MSEGNGYCTLGDFTAPRRPKEMDLDVPGLGKVRLRGFGVRQRSQFEKSVQGRTQDEIRERLILATVIKPEGLTVAHLKQIADNDAEVYEPIVEAALKITALSDRDVKALEKKGDDSAATSD